MLSRAQRLISWQTVGGLYLQVHPSGGKHWQQKYRVDGREKKLSIGSYPKIGLAEARRRRESAHDSWLWERIHRARNKRTSSADRH
jgi:hypothetical protein